MKSISACISRAFVAKKASHRGRVAFSSSAAAHFERVFAHTNNGQRISLHQGNILEAHTDAVVNPSNRHLFHLGGAGVAGNLLAAGGPKIQEESNEIVQRGGSLPFGTAVVTSAGSLNFKCIIHAVGPHWMGGEQGEAPALRRAIKAALDHAANLGLKSVALPVVSAGPFGLPNTFAAKNILLAIKSWCDHHNNHSVSDIILMDEDNDVIEAVESAFHAAFPEGPATKAILSRSATL